MIASLSVVAILSSFVVSTAFAGFSDVPADAYYADAVQALVDAGVVDGTAATFSPAAKLQRQEAAKFAVMSADLTATLPAQPSFKDVPATSSYYSVIETAVANGVLGGYSHKPGYFGPTDTITREQFAKILVEAFDLPEYTPAAPTFPDVNASMWSYKYVETAYHWSVINGYATGKFGPTDEIVRQDGAVMTAQASDPSERAAEGDDDDDDDSGDLEGGAGSVEEYKLVTAYNNEEVGQSDEDVVVYGMTVEADTSSDLGIQAMKLVFNEGGVGTTSDFDDYATEVSVWQGDQELARVDAGAFTDDNNWTKTVSFEDMGIVRSGETEEFTIAVSAVSNLDSGDATDTWTLDVTSVRFVDAQDAIISEDPTLDTRTFSFETFATASDIEMKFSEGDDTINNAHVIDVDDTDDTDDAEILSFMVEVEGNSDLLLKALPVNFDVTTASHVDDMATAFTLYMDDEKIGDVTVGSGSDCIEDGDCVDVGTDETYLFDDLDVTLEAGETYEFVVSADLLSTGGDLNDGDTIAANVTQTSLDDQATNGFDVEDEDGEELADGDTTGSVTGDAHATYDNGITVAKVSTSKTKTTSAEAENSVDVGNFEIVFDVTAFGADMYIDKSTEDDNGANAAGQGLVYDWNVSGTDGMGTEVAVLTAAGTITGDNGNVYKVREGETRRFTLTIDAPSINDNDAASEAAQYELIIESINWGTATNDTNANYYTFDLDDYKTGYLFLQSVDAAQSLELTIDFLCYPENRPLTGAVFLCPNFRKILEIFNKNLTQLLYKIYTFTNNHNQMYTQTVHLIIQV